MGRSSQAKGRGGERELAALLRENGYPVWPAADPQNYGTVPDLVGLDGIHIECKRVERLNVPAAMQQAVRDSERFHDGLPALFHRRNREGWIVSMELSDWLKIYGVYQQEESGHGSV